MPRDYDSTIARIAGNIAAGIGDFGTANTRPAFLAEVAVRVAFAIVDEIKRIEAKRSVPFEVAHHGPNNSNSFE